MKYRTLFVARHCIPDDRLAHVSIDQEGAMAFSLKAWKVSPLLLPSMAALSEGLSDAEVFDFDPDGAWADIGAWFERVPATALDGRPMAHRVVGTSPMFFEILVNEDMITPEVVRELNAEVMPYVCSRLHWAMVPKLA